MADSKTYLNVPYAQKDAAKALGARWDPANKKWYVPAGKDLALFAQWQTETASLPSPTTPLARAKSPLTVASAENNSAVSGVITHATIKDFVAYSGDAPPWD
jgi:hypothetical protein